MLSSFLFGLAEKHRPGMGVKPWIKYIDQGYDTRTQSNFYIRLRGYGWEVEAHASKGNMRAQLEAGLAALGSTVDASAEHN